MMRAPLLLVCCLLLCAQSLAQNSFAIIGGGVQGVLAAVELSRQGKSVTLFEKSAAVLSTDPVIELDGILYDWLSLAALPAATAQVDLNCRAHCKPSVRVSDELTWHQVQASVEPSSLLTKH